MLVRFHISTRKLTRKIASLIDVQQKFEELDIGPMKKHDLAEFISCISASFTDDEPTTKALGVTKEDLTPLVHYLAQHTLNNELGIVARNRKTGKFVGCSASEDVLDDCEGKFYSMNAKWAPFGRELLRTHQNKLPHFQRGQCVHRYLGAVNEEFKGKGYYSPIVAAGLLQAAKLGFSCVLSISTGSASCTVSQKFGSLEKGSLKFSEYEFNGARPFQHVDGYARIMFLEDLQALCSSSNL